MRDEDGGSGSGPRHTTAHCHGEAKTPCDADRESACAKLPGCAWKPTNPSYRYFYCGAVHACRELEDEAGCSAVAGCDWSL